MAQRYNIDSVTMLEGATAADTRSEDHTPRHYQLSFQVVGRTSSGAGSATVVIEASNVRPSPSDDGHYIELGTMSLVLSPADESDGFAINAPYAHIRARLSAISGTGASVDLYMGG